MAKVLITTVPFADKNLLPLELLDKAGAQYLINPIGRKLKEEELLELIGDFDVLIAGTELITNKVINAARNLKLISRVGVGLDGVDLVAAKERGVRVSYTPDAPAPAVAELTLGLMLTLLRSVHVSNAQMHLGRWQRFFGRRLSNVTVGLIGVGRIGTRVLHHLKGFGVSKVLVNDLAPNEVLNKQFNLEWVDKEQIYNEADIISLHLPMTALTKNMIGCNQLKNMKADALLINTSRGGIINEQDLYDAMKGGHLGGAAIDVFDHEPYAGNLAEIERCLLTAHMGSMSVDCRTRMEIEATEEAVRFIAGKPLVSEVPQAEYDLQSQRL